jgi:hypothetical protein
MKRTGITRVCWPPARGGYLVRKSLLASAGVAGLFAACSVHAGTYIQLPPVPGSVSMIAFDVTYHN